LASEKRVVLPRLIGLCELGWSHPTPLPTAPLFKNMERLKPEPPKINIY